MLSCSAILEDSMIRRSFLSRQSSPLSHRRSAAVSCKTGISLFNHASSWYPNYHILETVPHPPVDSRYSQPTLAIPLCNTGDCMKSLKQRAISEFNLDSLTSIHPLGIISSSYSLIGSSRFVFLTGPAGGHRCIPTRPQSHVLGLVRDLCR